ncbi:methyltransferase [Burkholderia thailandensis]|uniref:methyltransferase n=1 Tax=Burkholderia thailandensis TaxID=57975 RepID=UPI003F9205EF
MRPPVESPFDEAGSEIILIRSRPLLIDTWYSMKTLPEREMRGKPPHPCAAPRPRTRPTTQTWRSRVRRHRIRRVRRIAPRLSAALRLARRPTEALANMAVALGFARRDADRYMLTTLSEAFLVERSPTYFGPLFDLMYETSETFSLKSLEKAIRDNAPHAYDGPDVFRSHEQHAELAARFTRAMESVSAVHAPVWPTKLDLSRHRVMLDVGGGSGVHTRGALSAWPALRGILFDLPNVCELSRSYFAKSPVREHVTLHPGDMWNDPFPDADLHFYSNVFHIYPREKNVLLAHKSFEALAPGGRIVLHEILYRDDKSGPLAAAAFSLKMLSWTEGEQYLSRELTGILTGAGFSSIETIASAGHCSVVTGMKR